jgi:small subunit ribosomal protein S20
MANTKSAAKRARQNPRRTLRNRGVTTQLRSLTKRHATGGGKADDMRALISALDKAAKRGIIHRNVAQRRKARLNKAAAKRAASS